MSTENIPNVNSEEFEKILEENGWTKKKEPVETDRCNVCECGSEKKSLKDKLTLKNIVNAIDEWSMEHPGLSLAIFFGSSSFFVYKLGQSFIAGAVHKGNLKTIRYLDKIGR